MKCLEFKEIARDYGRGEWLAAAVRAEAETHLETCETCRREVAEQAALDEQLQAVRVDLEGRDAPAGVEARLRSMVSGRRRKPNVWKVLAAGAIAAGLLVGGFLMGRRASPQPVEFLPLRAGPVLHPGESAQVLRIQVPRAELVRFGYPYEPDAGQQKVQADVLIGEDGIARAIRFVQ